MDGIKNHFVRIVVVFLLILVVIFQLKKRNSQLEFLEKQHQSIKSAESEYAKVIFQRSVYSDSIYNIYIANINARNELIFLKKGALPEIRRESNFFVHIYPKDPRYLVGKANHNPINFESNFISFSLNGECYHVAHTTLPNYSIDKLNLGQYAFRGDNGINYKIKNLIDGGHIAKIIKENKEDMAIFEYTEETF